MPESFAFGLKALVVAFFAGQLTIFLGLLVWTVWEDSIQPRLVPQSEIDALAEAWIAEHSSPEETAYNEHWRAWHHCEGADAVKWGRVRKAIARRLATDQCAAQRLTASR